MNVVFWSDGADEFFETSEIIACFGLLRLFVLVSHSSLDVASNLVEISSFVSILMSFNENGVVISWHTHRVDEVDVERHDSSNKFAVLKKQMSEKDDVLR